MSRSPKLDARRLAGAEKAKEAAVLRVRGFTYDQIAKELGWAHRSVAKKALDAHLAEVPREDVETLRDVYLARIEETHRTLQPLLADPDVRTRLKAAEAIGRGVRRAAEVAGVLDTRPVVAVQVNTASATTQDLALLTPTELRIMRYLLEAAAGRRSDFSKLEASVEQWVMESDPTRLALPAAPVEASFEPDEEERR